MTRSEEIQKLIDEEIGIDNYGSSDYQVGLCDGVRLADKTMIDKACNIFCHIGCPHETDDYDCLKDKCTAWKKFRKMMEE